MRLHSSAFFYAIDSEAADGIEGNCSSFVKKLPWSDKEIPESESFLLLGEGELDRIRGTLILSYL